MRMISDKVLNVGVAQMEEQFQTIIGVSQKGSMLLYRRKKLSLSRSLSLSSHSVGYLITHSITHTLFLHQLFWPYYFREISSTSLIRRSRLPIPLLVRFNLFSSDFAPVHPSCHDHHLQRFPLQRNEHYPQLFSLYSDLIGLLKRTINLRCIDLGFMWSRWKNGFPLRDFLATFEKFRRFA